MNLDFSDPKIKALEELTSLVDDLKSEGKTIVMCHGVFDLIHPGHVACPGCGAAIAMKLALKVMGPKTMVVIPACCWGVIAGPYPQSSLKVPVLQTAFATAGAAAGGLRAALRQAPKVILVGEMRDRETVEIGLSAAETGHLVLTTLHTTDAGSTVNRIIGMFPNEDERQIRIRLADALRWVVCQRLLPKIGGGRVATFEIMGTNLRVQDAVLHGESDGKTFYDIMEASGAFGMVTFDRHLVGLYEEGQITQETAMAFASQRGIVGRGIDSVKSARGETTTDIDKLEIDRAYNKAL